MTHEMKRPRIKFSHRPVRYHKSHVRIGGIVPGIRRDVLDEDGSLWSLLCVLDGTRTAQEIVSVMAELLPHLSAETVLMTIDELTAAGYIEDAEEPLTILSSADAERYSRGRELRRWVDLTPGRTGWEAQELLREVAILVVGLGGIGCVASLALVLSGVGRVHCVDRDVVELSNLNRQLHYTQSDIGRFKAEVAVERLRAHNSNVDTTGAVVDVSGPEVLREVARGFDLLLLCADRPRQIRSWANEVCTELRMPWVYGGYHGPLATVGLFRPGPGPCFECTRSIEQEGMTDKPALTEWPPAVGRPQPHAADATSVGLTGNLAAHAALGILTDLSSLPSNLRFGYNLVTRETIPPLTLDSPHPRCPRCKLLV